MKFRQALGLGAGVLLALGAGRLLLERLEPRPTSVLPDRPAPPSSAQRAEELGQAASAERRTTPETAHLLSADGRAVVGAGLSWMPLPLRLADAARWPPGMVPWEESEAAPRLASTRSDGSFTFEPATPFADRASVVWITHREHEAACVLLEPGAGLPDAWPRLQRADPLRLAVVTADGSPAPNAAVEVWLSSTVIGQAADAHERAARRYYRERVQTDADGRALSAATGLGTVARASMGNAVSAWTPLSTERETLIELVQGFTLLATLTATDETQPGPGARIECTSWSDGAFVAYLGTLPAPKLGRLAPSVLPAGSGSSLQLDLLGGTCEVQRQVLPLPAAGAHSEVTFALRVGHSVPVRVRDPDGAAIAEAAVEARWQPGVGFGSGLVSASATDRNGNTELRGLAEGPVHFSARASGFQSAEGELWIPLEDPPLAFVLEPAARLAGRVTFEGEPVTDFEVSYWTPGPATGVASQSFSDLEGRFLLADIAPGPLALLATAEGRAPGEAQVVEVTADLEREVELVLPGSVTARGRVLDAQTGSPVAGATIVLCSCSGDRLIEALGSTATSDAHGEFELGPLNPSCAGFGVMAQGYGDHWDLRHDLASIDADLGVIALWRARPLRVRMVHDGSLDPTGFETWTGYGGQSERIPLDAHGEASIPNVRVGYQEVHLRAPGGTELVQSIVLQDLDPADEWSAEFRWNDETFAVRLLEPPHSNPERLAVLGTFECGPAHRVALHAELDLRDDEWEATFTHVPDKGELIVSVNEAGVEIASGRFDLALASRAVLRLDGASTPIRVVDSQGEPVAQAEVSAVPDPPEGVWAHASTTDSEGWTSLAATNVERVLLHVAHPERGRKQGIACDLRSQAGEPFTVHLPPPARLRVFLRDGPDALPGVRAQLFHAKNPLSLALAFSGSDGALSFDGWAADEYIVVVRQPGYWPVEQSVRLLEGGAEHEIQVRRLADVTLVLQTLGGARAAHAPLELSSIELGESVTDWIEAARVQSSAPDLTTDAQGELTLTGVPHGTYRWRAPSLDAASEGTCRFLPGPDQRIELTLLSSE